MPALLIFALLAGGPPAIQLRQAPPAPRPERPPVRLAGIKAARKAAEAATGGRAVSAVRIALNGAWMGFEVRIHMPGRAQGWRCLVDADTVPPRVRERRAIPNPPLRKRPVP